jgi:hypothetical protein
MSLPRQLKAGLQSAIRRHHSVTSEKKEGEPIIEIHEEDLNAAVRVRKLLAGPEYEEQCESDAFEALAELHRLDPLKSTETEMRLVLSQWQKATERYSKLDRWLKRFEERLTAHEAQQKKEVSEDKKLLD